MNSAYGWGGGGTSYSRPGYHRMNSSPEFPSIPLEQWNESNQPPHQDYPTEPPPLRRGYYPGAFYQYSSNTQGYQPLSSSDHNPLEPSPASDGTQWGKTNNRAVRRTCWQIIFSQDLWSISLLLMIWSFLCLSCVFLLFLTFSSSAVSSEGGVYVTASEVVGTIAISAIPNIFGVVLNEVLVERCWRRVQYFALDFDRFGHGKWDDKQMAKHLRASNFGWWGFCKRAPLCRFSSRDYRVLFSWLLLRFGTTLALASTQYCVAWEPVSQTVNGLPLYLGNKRIWWLVVPPALHALSITGTFAIWLHTPLALIRSRYDDHGLWKAYQPFVDRVRHGSVASSDDVAKVLEDNSSDSTATLQKLNKPGLQLGAKLKGTAFGLICMHVPPALVWVWTFMHQGDRDELWRNDAVRFGLHLAFLIQNVLYVVALDFIIWNLSIEGLCKSRSTKSPGTKKMKHLRGLGKSAGLSLLLKVWRQRRPWRASLMLWLFYVQACAIRGLTSLYLVTFQALHYGSENDQKDIYDPDFWLGWVFITASITYPPIILWLLWPFQAPICEQDGWRWVKINDTRFLNPSRQDIGFYGVHRDEHGFRATMGMNVMSFADTENEVLM